MVSCYKHVPYTLKERLQGKTADKNYEYAQIHDAFAISLTLFERHFFKPKPRSLGGGGGEGKLRSTSLSSTKG